MLSHRPNTVRRRSYYGLLDTAFEQIRHYTTADAAVSLRLMRAFLDTASTTQDLELRAELAKRARRVAAGCAECLLKGRAGKSTGTLARYHSTGTVQG
jgi:hypothetical protein